jgi:uncharacterized membrane protein YgdD (TMEM256/DUF423 family)
MHRKASAHSSRSASHNFVTSEMRATIDEAADVETRPREGGSVSGPRIVATGALLAAAAVVLGAFGAHGLRSRVTPDQLAVFETAVRYHVYHALALILLGLFALRGGDAARNTRPGIAPAFWCLVAGIVIFSGSLYVLVLSGQRWLGAVTPIGGIAFIAGWLLFARAALLR